MKAIRIMYLMPLILLSACNTTTTDNNNTNNENTTTELVLENKTEFNADSTAKIEYQMDKNSGAKYGSYKETDIATGKLKAERTYKNDQIDGVEKIYFPNGQVDGVLSYKDGVHHGEFTYYYEDGKVKQKGNYVNGKIEGILVGYYQNGNLKEEVTHVGGVTQGVFKEYNENGTIKAEGEFTSKGDQENLEQGLFQEYDENGKLVRKMICKEGQCCTTWTLKEGDTKPKNKICEAIIAEQTK